MKNHWIWVGLATAGLGFAIVANSQEPPTSGGREKSCLNTPGEVDPFAPNSVVGTPTQVQIQVEFVDMSQEALTKLLFLAKPKGPDATALRQQVQEMVSKKEAKVLETQIAIAKSGSKSTNESLHEFIYPTEFTPTAVEERADRIEDTQNAAAKSGFCFNPSTPTAFETRNVGTTLEVEPRIGDDNQTIDLRLVPEIVWHTGNTVWHEGKDANGNPFKMPMPDFYTLRLNTDLTCVNGQYALAGVLSPKDDKGEVDMTRKLMVFVKCDVIGVK